MAAGGGLGFENLAQAGVQNAEAQAAQKRELQGEQRKATLKALLEDATTPQDKVAAIQAVYHQDPGVLKQHVANLTGRLTGRKPQPVVTPEAAQSARVAPIAARGTTPQQQELALEGQKQQQQLGYQGQLGEQKTEQQRAAAQQKVKDFADTYKRMTGKDAPPELLQAVITSALGGDKVLSTMEQAEALKARTEYQNATLGLRQAGLDLQKARLDAQNNPGNPQFQLKLREATTAATNADARMKMVEARYKGTWNGEPLAGDILDTEGNPVGPANAPNVRPTGTQRERATLATSALDQMKDLTGLLTSRSDLFGPAAGHITNFRQWVGSQDPDAQRFKAAARTAADHLAGVFGGRSQAALQAIYDVIGNNITNPQAAIAGIDQMAKAADVIQRTGSYRTVGGGAASPTGGKGGPAPKKTPGSQGKTQRFTDNGVIYNIPSDQVQAFKKDHPNAR